MKKLLWCGGSHLASARSVIDEYFQDCNNTYYVTAGWRNRRWAVAGGRYSVSHGRVGGNGWRKNVYYDLNDFDKIIYVGHYVQIQRYYKFDPHKIPPLSRALVNSIHGSEDFLVKLPTKTGIALLNEPITMFPKYNSGNHIIMVDPMACYAFIKWMPNWIKQDFLSKANLKLRELGLIPISQSADTFDSEYMLTRSDYLKRSEKGDMLHMNEKYWEIQLQILRDSTELYAT